MEIEFIVNGEPFGKKRPRATSFGGHARIHNDPANERYELKVINAYQNKYGVSETPKYDKGLYVGATIYAYYSIPNAFSKKKIDLAKLGYLRPTKKPDCDNVAKSILDALNGIVYHDDSQVVSLVVEKVYGENAYTKVAFKLIT